MTELLSSPDFSLERLYQGRICGIDEAGRGPLAGCVVAAAVILNEETAPCGINDSKIIKPEQRERLYDCIIEHAEVGIGIASVEEIDSINILHASLLAMSRAFENLAVPADVALIDGNKLPKLPCYMQAVVGGDAKSLSIAAASIVAKVTRDRIMREVAKEFPHYGFERHVGYSTKKHLEALTLHGVTPHHRKSFAPVREVIERMQLQAA